MALNPFQFVTDITHNKSNIMVDDLTEKEYPPFMVNRSLSYFPDCVLMANEMNINHHLDKRLQFDFLINIVRKKKRFSKWAKAQQSDEIEVIKEYYGYSNEKARQIRSLLSSEQIDELKKKVYRGGKRK
jgi:flavorubredoxin